LQQTKTIVANNVYKILDKNQVVIDVQK